MLIVKVYLVCLTLLAVLTSSKLAAVEIELKWNHCLHFLVNLMFLQQPALPGNLQQGVRPMGMYGAGMPGGFAPIQQQQQFGYPAPPGMGYGAGVVGPGPTMMPLGPPRRQQPISVINLFVPSASVGGLIGAGGSHIKHVIREANAFVTVS